MYDETALKKLKRYVRTSPGSIVLGIIFIILAPIVYNGIYDLVYSIVWGLTFLIIGIVLIGTYFHTSGNLNKKLKKIEQEGNLPLLLNDFMTGGKAFEGRMILGQQYIIGKGFGTVLAYYEISNIYQKINYTNGIENQRSLMAVTTYGKTMSLCALKLRGKSDNEANHVISYICSMNPRITVGYQGK